MSQARVEDLEALKNFKIALLKFQETANVALTNAEGDLTRTSLWLDIEQTPFWNVQVRKRAEALSQAEERLRMKKVFKDVVGTKPSTVDEEKAVRIARQRLEEARQKVAAVAQWKRRMEKIGHDYKGTVQRLATTVQSTLPATIASVEVMIRQLEQYVGLRPVEVQSEADAPRSPDATGSTVLPGGTMARAPVEGDQPEPPPEAREGLQSDKLPDPPSRQGSAT